MCVERTYRERVQLLEHVRTKTETDTSHCLAFVAPKFGIGHEIHHSPFPYAIVLGVPVLPPFYCQDDLDRAHLLMKRHRRAAHGLKHPGSDSAENAAGKRVAKLALVPRKYGLNSSKKSMGYSYIVDTMEMYWEYIMYMTDGRKIRRIVDRIGCSVAENTIFRLQNQVGTP